MLAILVQHSLFNSVWYCGSVCNCMHITLFYKYKYLVALGVCSGGLKTSAFRLRYDLSERKSWKVTPRARYFRMQTKFRVTFSTQPYKIFIFQSRLVDQSLKISDRRISLLYRWPTDI